MMTCVLFAAALAGLFVPCFGEPNFSYGYSHDFQGRAKRAADPCGSSESNWKRCQFYTSWTSWQSCEGSCGGGTRRQTRNYCCPWRTTSGTDCASACDYPDVCNFGSCSRFCSCSDGCSLSNACYPGSCGSGSCVCAPNYGGTGCRSIAVPPSIPACYVKASLIQNGTMTYLDAMCFDTPNVVKSTAIAFSTIQANWSTLFEEPSNDDVSYVTSFKVGVKEAALTVKVNDANGVTWKTSHFDCDAAISENNPVSALLSCPNIVTNVTGQSGTWKQKESVEVLMSTTNGGTIGLRDQIYSRACSYPYKGQTRTHSVKVFYDAEGPINPDCPGCTPKPIIMDIGDSYVKQPKVTIKWEGWIDDPAGVGQIEAYAYKLKNMGGVLKEDGVQQLEASVGATERMIDITLLDIGVFSLILKVKDNAEPEPNFRLARRFVMFDNSSSVMINPGHPMLVETANPNTSYVWLTSVSNGSDPQADISVSWLDHFENKYHHDNKLLGSVALHSTPVDLQYDLLSGQPPLVRSAASIPNVNAIYKFLWASMVNPDFNKTLQDQANWQPINDFYCTKTIPVARGEGDAIAFLVRAYDVMENYQDDYVFTYVDTSPPIIDNIRILWKPDNSSAKEEYDLTLAFDAYDYQSGISEVVWQLVDASGSYSSQGNATVKRPTEQNPGCPSPWCYCTKVNFGKDCLFTSFEVKSPISTSKRKRRDIPNYDYQYTVTVTNGAMYKATDTVHFNATNKLYAPENIQAAAVNATSIRVTWILPDQAVNPGTDISYTARVRDNYFGNMTEATVEGFGRKEAIVGGLKPYWNYTCYVIAFSVAPRGDRTEINGTNEASVSTLQSTPGSVETFAATNMQSENLCHSMRVSWTEPSMFDKNGVITGYVVTGTANEKPTATMAFPVTARAGVVPNLDPNNVQYTFYIEAQTAAGTGTPSDDRPQVNTGVCGPANFTSSDVAFVITSPGSGHEPRHPSLQVTVQLDDAFFNYDENGVVRYSGIIVADVERMGEGENKIMVYSSLFEMNSVYTTWAIVTHDPPYKAYRATADTFSITPARRKRDEESGPTYYTIGGDGESCSANQMDVYCDGYLQSERHYQVKAFKCTAGGCRETQYLTSQFATTKASSSKAWIAGAVIGPLVLIAVVVVVTLILLRRRGKPKQTRQQPATRAVSFRGGNRHQVTIHDNIYTMETNEFWPQPIRKAEFVENITLYHQDDDHRFKEEFKLLKDRSPQHPKDTATNPTNKDKNRYQNTIPFDHSRVVLEAVYDTIEGNADYINASFIPGHNANPEYIAAQGPLKNTVLDFWRMVWEQDVTIVVMVTKCEEKGKEKCFKYWPQDTKVGLGDMRLQLKAEDSFGYYVVRTINIRTGNESRVVKQFQFTEWPESGVPDDPSFFLDFMQSIRGEIIVGGGMPGPLLVHCSTGTSRTGVFLAVDRLLHIIKDSPIVDVFKVAMDMREHRCNMIAAEGQYIFVYDCVKTALERGIEFIGTAQPMEYDNDYYTADA